MIKLPKAVSDVMMRVEEKKFSIYAVGGCVRDSLLGFQPLDWDLATDATWQELVEILPEAEVLNEKLSVVRLLPEKEKGDEGLIIDIATFRVEKDYDDHKRPSLITFVKDIESDLKRRDFTITAIAVSPSKGVADPFNGREDLKNKILKTVGDPDVRFKEDPSRMIRGIRMAAEHDLIIEEKTFKAMVRNAEETQFVSKEKLLDEFLRIISSEKAGEGLRFLAGADLMPFIIGEEIAHKMSRHELDDFSIYCDNIHKTKRNELRRTGLFYYIFRGSRSVKAASVLPHTKEYMTHFQDQYNYFEKLYFMKTTEELKRLIAKIGMDRYTYLHNLSKAQRIIMDGAEDKIVSREIQMSEIKANKEPIFIEDLAIDGDHLIEAGFSQGEDLGKMLLMLLDAVHKTPKKNNKKDLIKLAKIYKRNPIRRHARNVRWLR